MGVGLLITDAWVVGSALSASAVLTARIALVANAVLLVAAALVRFPPRRRTSRELRPTEIALLRSGPAAAVATALVLLHARAAVDAVAPGMVRRAGTLPRGCDPLARLVYESLARPGGPRELAARGPVRGALSELAAGLAGAGLVLPIGRRVALRVVAAVAGLLAVAGPAVALARDGSERGHGTGAMVGAAALAAVIAMLALRPWRTAAGRRLMRRLRRRHADLTPEHEPDAAEWSPQLLGLAVALYGAAALRLTFPRFAAQGGLLRAPARTLEPAGRRVSPGS